MGIASLKDHGGQENEKNIPQTVSSKMGFKRNR